MKIKNIYKIGFLLVLSLALQSRKNGPATVQNLQVTGAPGSTGSMGTCANSGCHVGGNFNTTISMSVLEEGGTITDKYEPGKTYTLKITTTANSGMPGSYGFQAVALNAANAQAGDWGTLPSGIKSKTLSNRNYAEHSLPSSGSTFEVPWVAPAAGTGMVTFYTATVASNDNDNVGGDSVAKNMLSLQEKATSGTSSLDREQASMKVLPNPVSESLRLEITSRKAGNHHLRFVDINGAMVKELAVSIQIGVNTMIYNVDDLTPGLYVIQLCGEGHLAATQMLKR